MLVILAISPTSIRRIPDQTGGSTGQITFLSKENSDTTKRWYYEITYNTYSIDAYRDSGCSNVLDDYAASGNLLRSPKYIFRPRIHLFPNQRYRQQGNSFYTLRVQSESTAPVLSSISMKHPPVRAFTKMYPASIWD